MPRAFPVRVGSKSDRIEEVPRPFSQEWLQLPEVERQPPVRRARTLPSWVPSERILSSVLVILLVLVTVIASGGAAPRTTANIAAPTAVSGAVAAASATGGIVVPPASATNTPITAKDGTVAQTTPESTVEVSPTDTPELLDPRAILPRYRVVSYYGHPANDQMGILGEFDKEDLLAQLRDEATAFEQADPTRPVMPAFEVIASVAQNWPADNDTYLLHTDDETIQRYVDFARDNEILIILDLQIGHSTVVDEIDRVSQWLKEPFVHLALDPEFAMREGDIPGDAIGTLDASDIAEAQQMLAEIVAENDLPPKMLIIHRFTENMITNSDQIARVPGVQTVIDFDGFGDPASKIEGYDLFLDAEYAEFAAIKLFYQHDSPVIQPQEVVALRRSPDVVIYQ